MKSIFVLLILTCSACTQFGASSMFTDSDRGFVMLAGDAEGIRAYNDGIVGIIADTTASPDIQSSYWQNRDTETEVKKLKTPYYSPTHPRFSISRQQQQQSKTY